MNPELFLISPDPVLTRAVRRIAGELRVRCQTYAALADARAGAFAPGRAPRAILIDGPARDVASVRRWSEQEARSARLFWLVDRATPTGPTSAWGGEMPTRVPRPETESEVGPFLTGLLGDLLGWACAEEAGAGLDALVGRSVAFRGVVDSTLGAAAGAGPVLLTGENGSGKSLFARVIHAEGSRAANGFVALCCAGLPVEMLERLLDAPRSASPAPGAEAFQPLRAEGGSLYLEDVTSLGARAQAGLMAFLDARDLARAQGLRGAVADLRLITGSRTPLAEAVARGRFRADLAERLGATTIRIPSLRERPSDILLLAEHFLSEFARREGAAVAHLADAVKPLVTAYRWPGNVRELIGVLQVAAQRVAESREIGAAHLPSWVAAPRVEAGNAASGGSTAESATRITASGSGPTVRFAEGQFVIELPEEGVAFLELERAILRAALERTRGNVVRAAKLLRLGRGSLRYRLEKHGIMQPKRRRSARRRPVKETGAESLQRAS
jgi:DNA-binding NtrC family response regulator